MTADPRLPELFERAAELDGDARARWLAELGREQPALAAEIESLLAAGDQRGARLDEPAWSRLVGESESAPAAPPARLGAYRIVREVGRGGMGRVYLAEQEGEDFRRRVALKVLDRPASSDDDVRRFRDEVKILARLDHPGIARFLDGGRTPDGVWFLALEFVEGVDLVEHARRAELGVEARVRLFLGVLEAVASAHAQGVVHRDLKPGNVLVGADGRPRLLDFGISKLFDPNATSAPVTTTQTRAFTPAYASPEQFRGQGVGPASDTFSLGVILYELLCGMRPFGAASAAAALAHAVLEDDPDPPSTAGRRATEAGERTGAPARGPRPRLGRDLDAVCLKALRKLPEERYASVAAFAADLERWLAGRPVEALRGDFRYRATKLLRRHRAAIAVAAALAVAGVALVVAIAQRPAPSEAAPTPRPFPIPPVGAVALEELERRFALEPASLETGAALVQSLARAGRAQEAAVIVGRLRQIPGREGDPLVDYVDAIVALQLDEPQRALALSTGGLAAAQSTGRGELVPRLRALRGRTLTDLGRREEGRSELLLALREAEAAGDDESLGRILNDLAVEELVQGRVGEGERLLERALAASRRAGDTTRVGSILHNLAGIAALRGDLALAESRFRESASIARARRDTRRLAMAQLELAQVVAERGAAGEARTLREEAIAVFAERGDDTWLASARAARATAEIARGRLESIDGEARAIEEAARASGNRTGLALAERLRGEAAAARGELAEAHRRLEEARRVLVEDGNTELASGADFVAAEVALEAGEEAAAAALAARAAAPFREAGATDAAYHAEVLAALAEARTGRPADAARRLDALGPDASERPSVRLRLRYRAARAEVARRTGDPAAARRELDAAIAEAAGAERTLDELGLRLALSELEIESGERAAGVARAAGVVAQASPLGLGIAERARRIAGAG